MVNLPSRFVGWLTINRSCNLRCGWCYAKESGFIAEDMTLDIAKSAIEIYKGLQIKNVMLIGGEPTIHPRFLDIVRLIHRAGLNPLLVTNGVKFSDIDFAKATVAAGIHRIIVSLKGANDDQYQQLTGRGAFSLVQEGILNLALNGLYCTVSITICADTLSNFDEILETAVKSGAKQVAVNMERPVIVGKRTYANDVVAPRQMAEYVTKIYPKLNLSFRQRENIIQFYNKVSACPHRACTDCGYWKICGGGCRIHWLHWGANELIGNFQTEERR